MYHPRWYIKLRSSPIRIKVFPHRESRGVGPLHRGERAWRLPSLLLPVHLVTSSLGRARRITHLALAFASPRSSRSNRILSQIYDLVRDGEAGRCCGAWSIQYVQCLVPAYEIEVLYQLA